MSDETTTVEQPQNAAVAPLAPKSFAEKMAEIEARESQDQDSTQPDTQEAEATQEEKPQKAESKPSQDPDKTAQLEALAKELGYEIEAGTVQIRERAAFREQKRRLKAEFEAKEQELAHKWDQGLQQVRPQLDFAQRVYRAWKDRDQDALAVALGSAEGRQDMTWDSVQEEFISRHADPNYKRLRELEERDRQRQHQEQQQRHQAQQRAAQQQREQQVTQYKATLADQMKASKDPFLAALHDDPQFVDAIYRVQQQNYDRATDTTVTAEQALKIGNFKASLETVYRRLKGLFDQEPQQDIKKPKGKTSTVPSKGTVGAAASKKASEMTPEEYKEWRQAKYREMYGE